MNLALIGHNPRHYARKRCSADRRNEVFVLHKTLAPSLLTHYNGHVVFASNRNERYESGRARVASDCDGVQEKQIVQLYFYWLCSQIKSVVKYFQECSLHSGCLQVNGDHTLTDYRCRFDRLESSLSSEEEIFRTTNFCHFLGKEKFFWISLE